MNNERVRKHKRKKSLIEKIKDFTTFIRQLIPKKAFFESFQIALLGILLVVVLVGTINKIAPKSLFKDITDQPTTEQLYK